MKEPVNEYMQSCKTQVKKSLLLGVLTEHCGRQIERTGEDCAAEQPAHTAIARG